MDSPCINEALIESAALEWFQELARLPLLDSKIV